MTLIIISTGFSVPLAAIQPTVSRSAQIDTIPSSQPIRSSQVREILPEFLEESYIDLDSELSRSGSEIVVPTPTPTPKPTPKPTPTPAPQYKWMTFTATFYVKDGPGMNGKGITATGTRATAGRTIAVDPKVIPYGTKVYIEGWGYRIAEDCGGFRGNHIDIFVDSLRDIPRAGKITVRLRIVK